MGRCGQSHVNQARPAPSSLKLCFWVPNEVWSDGGGRQGCKPGPVLLLRAE